jgi:hypothetical protein
MGVDGGHQVGRIGKDVRTNLALGEVAVDYRLHISDTEWHTIGG